MARGCAGRRRAAERRDHVRRVAAATRIQACWRSFRDAVAYASYRSMMGALAAAQRECAAYDIQHAFEDYRARVGETASAEALLGAMGVMLAVEENVSAMAIQDMFRRNQISSVMHALAYVKISQDTAAA